MSIFKRGRYYWFHFFFEGRHVQRSTKQSNPRAARLIEAAHRTKLAKSKVGIEERKRVPTFSEAMAAFLNWSLHEHASHPSTHRRYVTSSKSLLRTFGSKILDTITVEDVEDFKMKRARQHGIHTKRMLRPASINRELACGKAMYNHARKGALPISNPFCGATFLTENNEQRRILTYEEEQRYLLAASQPLHDVAVIMVETGMRPGEVYRITQDNVSLADGWVFNPFGKTKAAQRKITLTARALQVIRARLLTAKGRYLFPHENDPNRHMLKVNNAHEATVRRSAVTPFRLYDLRHTFATRAAMSGMDLVTLAQILGHARLTMVMRYAHPTEQHQASAMRRLEMFNEERKRGDCIEKDGKPLQIPLQ